ncbi:MAG TPA: sulfatase-like hydrolase/transferase [Bryobacteraceae bacterium]|jgi:hypothetical protein
MLRRVLICFAFATWCFLNTWVQLAEGRGSYYARYPPLGAVMLPVVCWQLLVALAMLGLWEVLRHRGWQDAAGWHFLFLMSCFVPLGIASLAILRTLPFTLVPLVRRPLFWPSVFLLSVSPLMFAMRRPRAVSRMMRGLFLYSWPVLAVVLIQGVRTGLRFPESDYADGPPVAAVQSGGERPRVVWVVFDELSQEIAFANRPAGLQLPNLDRFRGESFYASAARAPSAATETSLPSLILGEHITETEPLGPGHVLLTLKGKSRRVEWGDTPNVFDTARRMGLNTALAGWYHPYGRLLNRSLTKCDWIAGRLLPGIEEPSQPRPLPRAMADRAHLQFIELPLVGHLPGVHPEEFHRKVAIERFSYLVGRAEQMAADPSMGLVLLHLPVPHPPAIYNRSTERFTARDAVDYLDNLALADRTLGAIRLAIEAAGLWDRTALLVSSDHGWRRYLWRGGPDWTAEEEILSRGETMGVPFLLRLPHEKAGVSCDRRFDTVVSRRLITAILDGSLTDPSRIGDAVVDVRPSP